MRVRALDSSHDFTFGAGNSNYLVANAAIAQNINTRLSSFLGNCFFDLGAGLDWFNLLGSKDQTALQLAISSVILNTTGVTSLGEVNLSLATSREFSVSYTAVTVYSTVTANYTFNTTL